MNGVILAIDVLRIANQNSGRTLFTWALVSETGEAVRASNGMWLGADCALKDMPEAQVYLLFEGNLPTQHNSTRPKTWRHNHCLRPKGVHENTGLR